MNLEWVKSTISSILSGTVDWDKTFIALRESAPPFEIRLYVLAGLFCLLLLLNGIVVLLRKRKSRVSAGISSSDKVQASNIEIPAVVSPVVPSDGSGSIDIIKSDKKIQHKSKKESQRGFFRRTLRRVTGFFWRNKLRLFNILLVVSIGIISGLTFFMVPGVVVTTPVRGSYMDSGEQVIEIEFDLPFDEDNIKFNVSPDVEGEWKFEDVSGILPLKRKARFYPKESFFPDNEVVIYVVGLRQWWSKGQEHEHAIEFRSPKIPDITAVIPGDLSENVPVECGVLVEYDSPVGKFVDIKIEIDPVAEFDLEENGKHSYELKFEEALGQDQEYKIDIYRTPRSYDVENGDDIEIGDTEKIQTVTFKTVTTPLVSSYEPKGDSVLADSVIKVVFDQPMDHESVEEHFSIEPSVEGEITWSNEKTFVLTPKDPLKKETDFKVLFQKGILSEYAGTTEEDISIKFKTIGKVKVSAFSPVSGSYGLEPSSTNVVVEFNQKVDHASAQQHFSISPAVAGSFAWEGNKLIYYTAGKINYSTRYNVGISAGVKTVDGLDSTENFNYYFVTRDNIFTLAVPWYKQQEGFSCNLAAARMALAYRGVYVSESQIKSAIGTGGDPNVNWVAGYGVHWGPVASYIGNYRNVSVKSGWNVAALAKEVEKGNPVIVWWYNRYSQPAGSFTLESGATGYKGMHSEVVRGFVGNSSNPTSLMTNDPWRGQLTYNQSLFVSTWAYLGYTAVVVY